jgi:hypothetical protein
VTTPTEERKAPTISEKTGKPKKAVRFKPDNEITNVVLFGINDLPLSVVRMN